MRQVKATAGSETPEKGNRRRFSSVRSRAAPVSRFPHVPGPAAVNGRRSEPELRKARRCTETAGAQAGAVLRLSSSTRSSCSASNNSFLCRVRSKDGAVGISVAKNSQQRSLYPIQVNRLQPSSSARTRAIRNRCWRRCTSTRAITSCRAWRCGCRSRRSSSPSSTCSAGSRTSRWACWSATPSTIPKVAVYRANGERDVTAEAVMENSRSRSRNRRPRRSRSRSAAA